MSKDVCKKFETRDLLVFQWVFWSSGWYAPKSRNYDVIYHFVRTNCSVVPPYPCNQHFLHCTHFKSQVNKIAGYSKCVRFQYTPIRHFSKSIVPLKYWIKHSTACMCWFSCDVWKCFIIWAGDEASGCCVRDLMAAGGVSGGVSHAVPVCLLFCLLSGLFCLISPVLPRYLFA